MLDPFGIQYESTIINWYPVFVFLIIMTIIHMVIWLFKVLSTKWKDSNNIIIRSIGKLFEKLFILLTFGYYIRNVLELSQFILISSINEIYELNTSDTLRLISFICAILMVIWYIAFLGLANYLIFTNYQLSDQEHNKLGEFFCSLRDSKKSRFYITMLLVRRLIFVSILISLTMLPSRQIIGVMMFFQFIYGVYIVFTRPYKETKINVIEIINEAYFSLFLITLMV